MGFPFNLASLFGGGASDDPDDEYNLTRRTGNPYMMNLYGGGGMDTGIDPEDPEVMSYLQKSREPMPSSEIYRDYLSSRPQREDYKSNIWQKIGAGALGLFGRGDLGSDLLNRGYNRAYEDWETQGKLVPHIARGADVGRTKELEAERFGITGKARKRTFEETQRKNKTAEEARAKKVEADEAAKLERERRADAREERAIASGERASRSLSLSEQREARAEEEVGKRDIREGKRERRVSYGEKEKNLDKAIKDLEDTVTEDLENDPKYSSMFTINRKGEKVPAEGNEAFLYNLRKSEIEKRKKKLQDQFYSEAETQGLIHKLGE